MAHGGGETRVALRVGDERRGGEGSGGPDPGDVQREVDLLGCRGRAILACRLTERARDRLNAKLAELCDLTRSVDDLLEENENLARDSAPDAKRRAARALLHVTRAQVTCVRVEAAYLLESLHLWCDLAESLVVVHAAHEDHGEPATQELWDVVDGVVAERDRMRLAAT